jgi:hypothetical protein
MGRFPRPSSRTHKIFTRCPTAARVLYRAFATLTIVAESSVDNGDNARGDNMSVFPFLLVVLSVSFEAESP